jgi:hypothetical protein
MWGPIPLLVSNNGGGNVFLFLSNVRCVPLSLSFLVNLSLSLSLITQLAAAQSKTAMAEVTKDVELASRGRRGGGVSGGGSGDILFKKKRRQKLRFKKKKSIGGFRLYIDLDSNGCAGDCCYDQQPGCEHTPVMRKSFTVDPVSSQEEDDEDNGPSYNLSDYKEHIVGSYGHTIY